MAAQQKLNRYKSYMWVAMNASEVERQDAPKILVNR